ncbi:MAG: hypothetical protein Q9P01_04095 [Anaerolineae bacterium]|nr:hypothetical protein [Anaerolineae bacterium]MDQ7034027.1 hypothetical protein [Anaerolineae bacterium]
MQWKQMDWSFMIDPFNLLNLRVVPVTLAIDAHGIIRVVHPLLDRVADFEELFVNTTFDTPQEQLKSELEPLVNQMQSDEAVKLALWEDASHLDEALSIAEKALSQQATDRTHFNLGVIYRMRYDSLYRQAGDFAKAVNHWTAALNLDPNNYIWRRRIQQYGPRLDKPYPFYDWIPEAREVILQRGETPLTLTVEPNGAEFATPMSDFSSNGNNQTDPDPEKRIYQDDAPLIDVEMTIVPPHVTAGDSVRVHVILRPREVAHWNNEVDEILLWVNTPDGWIVGENLLTVPNPQQAESQETRHFEFEVRTPQNAKSSEMMLSTYALYYVCEDENGVCLYRRRDIEIPIRVNVADSHRLRDGG